jgi:hypothetical protein
MNKKYKIFQQRPDLIVKAIADKEQAKIDSWEDAKKRAQEKIEPESDSLLKDTQDAFIDEARTCIEAARVNSMSVLDDEYEKIVKNSESLMKSAKIVSDMRSGHRQSRGNIIGGIAKGVATAGEFALDFIFKHPVVPAIKSFFNNIRR